MIKYLLLLLIVVFTKTVVAQNYYPFPTDSAQWNCLYKHQYSPTHISLMNYYYEYRGDTVIKNNFYKKLFYVVTEYPVEPEYIGGIREDSLKQIYFYPKSISPSKYMNHQFPDDTSEHLLYTFNNLTVGLILPINVGNTTIEVVDIDSVLVGNEYRKRYWLQNTVMFGDQWIEGIGSTKDLLSSFTEEFEWTYYTLCYTDSITYYINSPNGEDSCHYSLPTRINELERNSFSAHPNPVENILIIKCNTEIKDAYLSLWNIHGQPVHERYINTKEVRLDVSFLDQGVYIIRLLSDHIIETKRIIKK